MIACTSLNPSAVLLNKSRSPNLHGIACTTDSTNCTMSPAACGTPCLHALKTCTRAILLLLLRRSRRTSSPTGMPDMQHPAPRAAGAEQPPQARGVLPAATGHSWRACGPRMVCPTWPLPASCTGQLFRCMQNTILVDIDRIATWLLVLATWLLVQAAAHSALVLLDASMEQPCSPVPGPS